MSRLAFTSCTAPWRCIRAKPKQVESPTTTICLNFKVMKYVARAQANVKYFGRRFYSGGWAKYSASMTSSSPSPAPGHIQAKTSAEVPFF